MIHLDASTLEGGGQLPRLALCLSALTLTPIHLTNIRANRARNSQSSYRNRSSPKSTNALSTGKDGGLKESHLAALRFLAEACDAKVTGDEVGSREVVFKPRRKWCLPESDGGESFVIELKNPGSVFLILQALYPYILFDGSRATLRRSGKGVGEHMDKPEDEPKKNADLGKLAAGKHLELTLKGGTNVDKSMSLEYVQQVFIPTCKKIGLPDMHIEHVRRGWAGSRSEVGEVKITIDLPKTERGFELDTFRIEERGKIQKVVVNVLAHSLELREVILGTVREQSRSALGDEVDIEVQVSEDSAHESRLYILLVAHTSNGWRIGHDFLGSGRKARSEKERQMVVDKAVSKLLGDLAADIEAGACVDEHMQDQLVVFQALAKGLSVVKGRDGEGTLHAQTARWVCEQILGERGVKFDLMGGCEGVGFNAEGKDMGDATGKMKGLDLGDSDQDDDS